jgi:uncharacterized protein YodC (DUF2158 family)
VEVGYQQQRGLSAVKGESPMAGQFQPGDVVRVKSGGPNMTVDFWDSELLDYVCTWFEKNKRMQGRFNEAVLEKLLPEQPPVMINPQVPRR